VKRTSGLIVAIALLTACSGGEDFMGMADGSQDADVFVVDSDAEETAIDVAEDAMVDEVTSDDADVTSDAGDVMADAGTDATDGSADDTVAVSHTREFRGAWVATVGNINFPSRTGLSMSASQAELTALLNTMQRNRLNAVVFQVRPEGDAVYRSTLEPWSRYLTGRQGGDPGYDPLTFLVAEAHRRNIEVHAWFNPYRARSSATAVTVAPHISVTDPSAVVTYRDLSWMNPALPVVQDRLANVIRDVVTRYDIDGVHFDDYFYPYPATGMPFPDAADYMRYRTGGGTLALADWRRDNVNRMVQRIDNTVRMTRDNVRFGVSPFGIYRPGMPPGITGLDAYNAIYCDPVLWMRQGWVDYLAPQLYWPSTQTAQAYGALVAWWAGLTSGGRLIFAGNNLGQLGSSAAWSVDEIRRQVTLTRAQEGRGVRGNIWFTLGQFQSNRMGIADVFRNEFYQQSVLTPPMAGTHPQPEAPTVLVEGRLLRPTHPNVATLRSWVVYREMSGRWQLDVTVSASQMTSAVLGPGRYAVSAVNRYGNESRGRVVTVR
jgi:uncharacterized lipoprotein YddW (UPF0748 family)